LIANLSPIAIESAHCLARAINRIDYLLGENSREQRSNRSTRAVHAEGIGRGLRRRHALIELRQLFIHAF
jgi:hypothetical protein